MDNEKLAAFRPEELAALRLDCLRLVREGIGETSAILATASRYFDFVARGELDAASSAMREAQIRDAEMRLLRVKHS
jgi:hypothetical protein